MSVDKTLEERESTYGSFKSHAFISQELKEVMWSTDKWEYLHNDQKEALEMVQHKIARILNGDPNYIDNWHDIQGYTKLVEDRLLKESASKRE
jgi:hypothetical protein